MLVKTTASLFLGVRIGQARLSHGPFFVLWSLAAGEQHLVSSRTDNALSDRYFFVFESQDVSQK
jgi:hypothetical protein